MESRIPISCIRSLTDIIITLKILTAATRSAIAPIASMNIVSVLNVAVSVSSCEVASVIRTAGDFCIGVDLRVKLLFNCGNVIGVFHDHIDLGILVLATILVSIPLAVHDDPVIRGNTICRSSPRFENTDDADFRAGSGGERTDLNSASDLQVKFFSDGSPDEGIVNPFNTAVAIRLVEGKEFCDIIGIDPVYRSSCQVPMTA